MSSRVVVCLRVSDTRAACIDFYPHARDLFHRTLILSRKNDFVVNYGIRIDKPFLGMN